MERYVINVKIEKWCLHTLVSQASSLPKLWDALELKYQCIKKYPL